MPRTYQKKKPPPSYSIEELQEAVRMVKERKMSQREAANKFKIPKSVIQLRVSGKVSLIHQGAGRPTTLSYKEEETIVECLVARADFGYPCDRMELMQLVGEYIKSNNIKNVFKDDTPGEDWYLGFMRRHSRLTLKKAEHLQYARKNNTTPDIVYDFYKKLGLVYELKELMTPDKAPFIFNTDESGFRSDPSRFRGIGEKGKSLSRVSGGSGRESTTVLACASADGSVMPPMILFRGATTVQPRWVSDKAYPGTTYAVSDSGWMEGSVFLNWFLSDFVPHVSKIREEKNLANQEALLIFDGHNSHITLNLVKVAMANKITLMRLPSHLTDKLQPLDKCVFGPVKNCWEKLLVEDGKSKMGKSHQRLTKKEFVELLGKVWRSAMTPSNIKSGFKSTGIFPLDEKVFPENLFNPVDLKNYQQKEEKKKAEEQKRKEENIREETQNENSKKEREKNESQYMSMASTSKEFTPINNIKDVIRSPQKQTTVYELQGSATQESSPQCTPTPTSGGKSVIEIFAETLKNSNKKLVQITPTKKIIKTTRIKPERYGEVLTSEEVMNRLQKAEIEKQLKLKIKQENQGKKRRKINEGGLKKKGIAEEAKEKMDLLDKPEQKKKLITVKQYKPKTHSAKRNLNFEDSSDMDEEIDEEDMFSAPLSPLVLEEPDEVQYIAPSKENIKPGTHVLVNIVGGYRKTINYKYVCCIQSVLQDEEEDDSDHNIRVMGLKREDDHATTFYPDVSDIFMITMNQIVGVLPEPLIKEKDRKVVYIFPGSVAVFEKA